MDHPVGAQHAVPALTRPKRESVCEMDRLARISHHLTVEARNRPAITALRLLAVLNAVFEYARIVQEKRRRASRALY